MRKQERTIIWPVYFDSTKSRIAGRRVPRSIGVVAPKNSEVKEAAEKAGLKCELVADVAYPKTPWVKTGMLLVEKKGSKNQTVLAISKQLLKLRSVAKIEAA